MSTKKRALIRLNRLNIEFERILSIIEPIDDSELLRKPSKDEWSVIQVFNHLKEIEQLSIDYLEFKEKNSNSISKVGFITMVKFFFYKTALLLPLKFKMPNNLSGPSNEGDLESIVKDFEKLRLDFLQFVERQDEVFFKTASYKHTVVGRITIEKMFEFLRLHLKHHEKQMLRILIKIAK